MVKSKKKLLIGIGIIILLLLVGGLFFVFNKDTTRNQGQTCTTNDGSSSNCKEGLLCNVGWGSDSGVCNTVQQCISSGSTADAFEGSKVCFQGVWRYITSIKGV